MNHSECLAKESIIIRIVAIAVLTGWPFLGNCEEITPAGTPTYSLWEGPGKAWEADVQPVELGVKFRTDVAGEVTAIRFYRDMPIESGYVVRLWNSTGDLLGNGASYEGQGPTPGWQTVQIFPPIHIDAGQTYVASYYASNGRYSASNGFFARQAPSNGPLHALANEEDGNGVYVYGPGGGFPTQSHQATNYWVDVVFKPTPALPAPD